jgi:hypothetical protein
MTSKSSTTRVIVAGWEGSTPAVAAVDWAARQANRTRATLRITREGGLAVVGSRGLGGIAGLALGSVTRQVIHDCGYPVMVVWTRKSSHKLRRVDMKVDCDVKRRSADELVQMPQGRPRVGVQDFGPPWRTASRGEVDV